MYKLNESRFTDEEGNVHTLYGIENEYITYTNLSADKEKVAKLCRNCNKLDVSGDELPYILDDFLNS